MPKPRHPEDNSPPASRRRGDVDPTPSGHPRHDELSGDDLGLYAAARGLLVEILKKSETDPARAGHILREIDRAWRREDRAISYRIRQRSTLAGKDFRKDWAEHERRGHRVNDAFHHMRRKLGSTLAAQLAAAKWEEPAEPVKGERLASVPLVWETRIGEVLICELERHIGRKTRFSFCARGGAEKKSAGGPDIRLLVELFSVAIAERGTAGDTPALPVRGRGIRKPGSAAWFARMIKRLHEQRAESKPPEELPERLQDLADAWFARDRTPHRKNNRSLFQGFKRAFRELSFVHSGGSFSATYLRSITPVALAPRQNAPGLMERRMRHGNMQGRRSRAGNQATASAIEIEPLGVPPKVAFGIIGCGTTYGYGLLNSGELESYYLGRARRVTMDSIHRCIERRLAEAERAAKAELDDAEAPELQNATEAR